ncbi:MAG: LytTR family transcriptional regulator [Bacteroidales bacterium]|nr:LytTR family transcriptional regulator [Bacteroidales bacterium]
MRTPRAIYTLRANLLFIAGLVIFLLLFAITYTPSYGLVDDLVEPAATPAADNMAALWYLHESLCLPITCAIALVVTSLSRTLMLLTTRTRRLRESDYLWWQLAELAVTAIFINLFLSLLFHCAFMRNLLPVMLVYSSATVFPYTVYWLWAERLERDVMLAEAERTILRLRRQEEGEGGMIRFADSASTVRLVTAAESVVGIEAAGNYVTVIYLAGGRTVRYSLRNTMAGLEPALEGTLLMRCHRSWYINLAHVRLLRKQADGLYAEMDADGVGDIPVSKTYSPEVTQRFGERS